MTNEEANIIIQRSLFLADKTETEVVTSIEAFREFTVQVLKLAVPGAVTVSVGSSSIQMTVPDTETVRTFTLTNLFRKLDPMAPVKSLLPLVAHMSSLVRIQKDTSERDIENLLSEVVPLLKSRTYAVGNATALRRDAIERGVDPDLHAKLSWNVNSEIVAFPVVNLAHGYQFITSDQLTMSGLTSGEIQAIALQNVRSAYATLPASDYSKGSKEFSGVGGFASAFVLLPEFLESEMKQAGGPLCILSGDADHLFIVPLANEEFLNFVLGRVSTGQLHLPEIPPLVYQDGRLEAAMIEQVHSNSPSLI